METCYVRRASLTLKEITKVFRIGNDAIKVETTEYAENLVQYLGDASSVDMLTLIDMKTTLEKLQTNVTSGRVDITQLDQITHKSSKTDQPN